MFCGRKAQNFWRFLLNTYIFFYESAKKSYEKHRKENEQTLADLSSAHCRSQAKCQLVQDSYIKRIKSGYYL